MKGLAAAALALAVAIPGAAQRGAGHASFAGHSAPSARPAPAFHSNFAPRPAYRYNAAPLARAPIAYPSGMRMPAVRYPVAAPVRRPVFYRPNYGGTTNGTHRINNRSYLNYGYPYYPGVIYLGDGGLFDNSFDNYDIYQQPSPDYSYNNPPDYSDAYPQAAPPPDNGYAYPQAPPPGYSYAYPQPMPDYSQPPATAPQMQYVPDSADTVTLIFKDGRPPEQIQNYLATRTTLTVLDNGRRQEVALSDLDIPATIKANHETGVDFELPALARQ